MRGQKIQNLFLLPLITSIVQLIDQGIIVSLKYLNNKQLMKKLILADNKNVGN